MSGPSFKVSRVPSFILRFSSIIQRRREEIRRQRIESEQRRRDELRDGYAKLKYALPISNQKSSKVSLLDRGMWPQVFMLFVFSCFHSGDLHPSTGNEPKRFADAVG